MCVSMARTWRGDATHLDGAGHMASRSAIWVHEGPVLSRHQVTHHSLWNTQHGAQLNKESTLCNAVGHFAEEGLIHSNLIT